MKQLTVDVEVALKAANSVGSDAAELREELASLQREWHDIAHGWKGSAASAYAALWEQWHDGATRVVQTVADAAQDLTQAALLYAQQDEQSACRLQSASPDAVAPLTMEMGL